MEADVETGNSSASSIQVVLRKRPLIEGKEEGENDIVRCVANTNVTVYEPKIRVDLTPVIEPTSFEFDYVFNEMSTNAEIYEKCCQPLLDNVRKGAGAVVFAFGQTGSGKTYSMLGQGQTPGLYGLAVTELLTMARGENSLSASFYEVYGTKLYDLLNERLELKLLQDEFKNVHVVGLTHEGIKSAEDVTSLMLRGQMLRAIGTTHANDRSSRSHAVLEIRLHLVDQDTDGRLTFVDLAGSERATDTAEMDAKTRREGAEINKSLLALKECIRSMSMRKRHIPFRVSKLTQILRESFVGRCKTVVIATISPCQQHCEDTLNTLRYAHRIKELKPSSTVASLSPIPCSNCGLPVFLGDRHVCRRIQTQCPHCRQEMEKNDLEAHVAECKEVALRCPYCNERMLRGEQGKHNRRCTKLPVRCTACNQQVPRNLLEKHLLTDCNGAKEKCRYCRILFPRALLNSHEQNCDAMMKACEYCLQFVRISRMEAHLQQCPMNPTRSRSGGPGSGGVGCGVSRRPPATASGTTVTTASSDMPLKIPPSRQRTGLASSSTSMPDKIGDSNVITSPFTSTSSNSSPNMLGGPGTPKRGFGRVGSQISPLPTSLGDPSLGVSAIEQRHILSSDSTMRGSSPSHLRSNSDGEISRQGGLRRDENLSPSPPLSPYHSASSTYNRTHATSSFSASPTQNHSTNTGPSNSSLSPSQYVTCPYSRYGCRTRVSNATLARHLEESIRQHLDLVSKYADKMDVQNAELRRLIVNTKQLPPLPHLQNINLPERKTCD